MPIPMRNRGFTLIELLVVITIIVVLLALLTPALDKAIYQAELAVCAANTDASASGTLTYTVEQRRSYPSNIERRQSTLAQPDYLGQKDQPRRDLRPVIIGYVSLRALVCPLAEPIDLSIESSEDSIAVHSTYAYWAGWRYQGDLAGAGLFRLGDRFGFVDDATGRDVRANVLVSDLNLVEEADISQSSHPDRDRVMTVSAGQNSRDSIFFTVGTTASRWVGIARRGLLDLNSGFDDGSVQLFRDVELRDERFSRAPIYSDTSSNMQWKHYVRSR